MKQDQQIKLSLKAVSKNLKTKHKLYADTTYKIYNDLGVLSHPEVSTGLSIISQ